MAKDFDHYPDSWKEVKKTKKEEAIDKHLENSAKLIQRIRYTLVIPVLDSFEYRDFLKSFEELEKLK